MALESVVITSSIDAHKRRAMAVVDILEELLTIDMEEDVIEEDWQR